VSLFLDPDSGDADDIPTQNGYAYANNNPVMLVDPDGHWAWLAINAAFAAYDAYKAYKSGKGWKGVAAAAAFGFVGGGKFKLVKNIGKHVKYVKYKKRKAVAGKITGYRKHGLAQAMARDGGRGVSPKAILDAVRNPVKVVKQSEGKVKYVGKYAVVVLNKHGKVVTTYAKGSKGIRRR
jgi:predicted amidohydrolase YtcJ